MIILMIITYMIYDISAIEMNQTGWHSDQPRETASHFNTNIIALPLFLAASNYESGKSAPPIIYS